MGKLNGKLLILSFNFMFIMRNTIFCSLSFIIDIHAFFPEGSDMLRPIELNFQQCHWEQNSAVIMARNFANTTPSYANASLHPISKNNEPTKFYHEAPHGMVLSEIFEKCPPIE